ncbi:MAG TPA: DUF2240 family protein [Candidatus Thermoplasmatota archaeon]|nr:DUF2240 family protein [Candidatus Thermoplasmatota archaeon]
MTGTELEQLMVYAFQASARKRLLEEDLVRLLSHERHWFPPSRVRALVQSAKAQGCLRTAGAHAYELDLGGRDVTLPIDYRPDTVALEGASATAQAPGGASLFRRLVRSIAEQTAETETQVVSAVNQVQLESGNLLRAEVAAMVVAGLRGIDVKSFHGEVEASLQVKSGAK